MFLYVIVKIFHHYTQFLQLSIQFYSWDGIDYNVLLGISPYFGQTSNYLSYKSLGQSQGIICSCLN